MTIEDGSSIVLDFNYETYQTTEAWQQVLRQIAASCAAVDVESVFVSRRFDKENFSQIVLYKIGMTLKNSEEKLFFGILYLGRKDESPNTMKIEAIGKWEDVRHQYSLHLKEYSTIIYEEAELY